MGPGNVFEDLCGGPGEPNRSAQSVDAVMSEPFEVLEHTADIGFRAWGDTPAELFENAARAMMSIAAETETIDPRGEVATQGTGEDYESLLVNWLSEILYRFDAGLFAASQFRVDKIGPTMIEASLIGEARDSARHRWKLIVKAVTYHDIEVLERDGRWESRIFLDI